MDGGASGACQNRLGSRFLRMSIGVSSCPRAIPFVLLVRLGFRGLPFHDAAGVIPARKGGYN